MGGGGLDGHSKLVCELPDGVVSTYWRDYRCVTEPRGQMAYFPRGDTYETGFIAKDPHEQTTQYYGTDAASRITRTVDGIERVVSFLITSETNLDGEEIDYL